MHFTVKKITFFPKNTFDHGDMINIWGKNKYFTINGLFIQF